MIVPKGTNIDGITFDDPPARINDFVIAFDCRLARMDNGSNKWVGDIMKGTCENPD